MDRLLVPPCPDVSSSSRQGSASNPIDATIKGPPFRRAFPYCVRTATRRIGPEHVLEIRRGGLNYPRLSDNIFFAALSFMVFVDAFWAALFARTFFAAAVLGVTFLISDFSDAK